MIKLCRNLLLALVGACLLFFLCLFVGIMARGVVRGTQTVVTGAVVEASGGLPAMAQQMGGLWLKPSRIETNQVAQPDGSFRKEIQFIFNTTELNVGGLVLSRQPGEKFWAMEAYHNSTISNCVVGSLWLKDCRLLLIRDPDLLEIKP